MATPDPPSTPPAPPAPRPTRLQQRATRFEQRVVRETPTGLIAPRDAQQRRADRWFVIIIVASGAAGLFLHLLLAQHVSVTWALISTGLGMAVSFPFAYLVTDPNRK